MKTSSINRFVGNCMNYTAKKASGIFERAYKEPARYAAIFMVSSFVSKDAVNCVFYTYQSATNKKIPDDKRPFVAMLDFSQGIFNVVGQIAAFKLFDKLVIPKIQSLFSGHMPDKITNKPTVYTKTTAACAPDAVLKDVKDVAKELQPMLEKHNIAIDMEDVQKAMLKEYGHSSSKAEKIVTGVSIVMAALTSNALMKRVMSPLLATPIAAKYKEHIDKKKKQDPELNTLVAHELYQYDKNSDSKKAGFKSFA